GREVERLINEKLKPGTYEATFDGSNYPSGVYFYKLVTNDFTDTKKMLLIK
ncbi:MAG: T9SS type A sorting domain-containing protein, partial [Bacteroidetes bacterium]|nr:T9SS type A sorting domain-containing protein [Bacteroidota bacterium]